MQQAGRRPAPLEAAVADGGNMDTPPPTHLPPVPGQPDPTLPPTPDGVPPPVTDPLPMHPPAPVRDPPAGRPPPMRA